MNNYYEFTKIQHGFKHKLGVQVFIHSVSHGSVAFAHRLSKQL